MLVQRLSSREKDDEEGARDRDSEDPGHPPMHGAPNRNTSPIASCCSCVSLVSQRSCQGQRPASHLLRAWGVRGRRCSRQEDLLGRSASPVRLQLDIQWPLTSGKQDLIPKSQHQSLEVGPQLDIALDMGLDVSVATAKGTSGFYTMEDRRGALGNCPEEAAGGAWGLSTPDAWAALQMMLLCWCFIERVSGSSWFCGSGRD